jgi:hypothetical protein
MNWSGHIYVIGGLDSLMQPVATVWRGFAPLAVAGLPSERIVRGAGASVARAGALLPSPLGADATGKLVSADGRVAATMRSGGPCPSVAAGVYAAIWQIRGSAAVSRALVVVR